MNRVQSGILAATLGMEACWLFAAVALVSIVGGQDGPVLSFPAVLLLVGAAYGTAWFAERIDLPLAALRAASALLGAVLVTAVAQVHVLGVTRVMPLNLLWFLPWFGDPQTTAAEVAAVVATGSGLVLWWRGVRVAQREPGFDPAVWSFRIGLGFVCAEALAEAFLAPPRSATWAAVPFFALGLVGLSMAHLEEVGREAWTGSARRWIWLPPTVIAALALVAVSIGLGLYGSVWAVLRTVFGLIDRAIMPLLFAVVLVFGFIAELLVNAIRALLRQAGVRGSDAALPNFDQMLRDLQRQPGQESFWLHLLGQIIVGAMIAVVVGAVLLWLAHALGRRLGRSQKPDDESRESLWGDGVLGDELGDLASRLLGRFRRGAGGLGLDRLGNDPRGVVLRLYLLMLGLAERRGRGRAPWQTPVEFEAGLTGVFPGGELQVKRLTASFVLARYSPSPPPPETAAQAQRDWDALNRPETAGSP